MDYKKQWNDWFDGGNTIWSEYGYEYHSYKVASEIISKLKLPKGDIIQFGCGLGITIEKLCNQFGYDRVYGYDLFNPLNHPRIFSLDVYEENTHHSPIAYCDIDIGSLDTDREARYLLFNWAWGNLVKGGYILINNSVVDDFIDIQPKAEIKRLNEYDNTELWKNPHQNRLNTKTLVKRIKNGQSH